MKKQGSKPECMHVHAYYTSCRRTLQPCLQKGMQVLTVSVEMLCSLHHVHVQSTAYNLHLYIMQPAIACSHKVFFVQERQQLPRI